MLLVPWEIPVLLAGDGTVHTGNNTWLRAAEGSASCAGMFLVPKTGVK